MTLCSSTSESDTQSSRIFSKTVARDMEDRSRMSLEMRMMGMMNVSTPLISSSLGKLSTTKVSAVNESSRNPADQ